MSDEKALLGAIWEHPHEDTPRLMYADWMQENGQPERAEFIRVQCELAGLDEWDEERRPTLEKREKKLWKQFAKAWGAKLPADLRKSPFRRGFVAPETRRMNVKRFRELPTSVFRDAPAWDYTIEGHRAEIPKIAKCRTLARIGSLKFWSGVTAAGAARVLASPYLRNVRSLSLGSDSEWAKGLAALAANTEIENLAELDLQDGLDDAAAAVIASSPGFAKLRSFSVYHHTLTSEGLQSIFNSPYLGNLTHLTIPAWYGTEGAEAIAKSQPKFRLRKLVMYGAWMTDEGMALIANWPGLESVRSLSIGGHSAVLGPRALANSPHAGNLRELDLGLSDLSPAGAMALARSKTLNLKSLLIRMTPAGNDEAVVNALVKRFGKDAVKVRYPGQRKRN